MSEHLKKITARAKKIRLAKPKMKWTNAVKQASIELGYGEKKTPGRKPSAVIYARETKTKTGKKRIKVYARAKAQPKPKPGNELPPGMSKPRKPKPTPRKPSPTKTYTYVTPGGKVIRISPKGRKRLMGIDDAIQNEIDDFSTWVSSLANPPSQYEGLVTFRPKIFRGDLIMLAEVNNQPVAKYTFDFIEDYQTLKTIANAINSKTKTLRTARMNGITYKKGQPMMSLSGYPMKQEKIFVGSTAMACKKVRDMRAKKPRNVGELEKIYSVPEVEVKLVGRDKVKGSRQITSSEAGARLIRQYMDAYNPAIRSTKEMFGLLYLNYQNQVIGVYADSIGGQTATVTDIQYGLVVAIKLTAKAVILFHNHPSGTLKPSSADDRLTKNYIDAMRTIECNVIDHLILSGVDDGYYSYANDGKI